MVSLNTAVLSMSTGLVVAVAGRLLRVDHEEGAPMYRVIAVIALALLTGSAGTTVAVGQTAQVVIAKYDRDGELAWSSQASSTREVFGEGISTTRYGESYVTGRFFGPTIFGLGEPNETTLSSPGSFDVFVAKYSRDGELLWVSQAGGDESDSGSGVATTRHGESYVTGRFIGTTTFGLGEPHETTLTDTGDGDLFVAKYDRDGKLVWATSAGGACRADEGLGIAATLSGESYVTGASGEFLIAKYARDGELLWAVEPGGSGSTGSVVGWGIASTERGESYVTGSLFGTVTFGLGEPNETVLTSTAGSFDIFVAKYDRHGRLVWAIQAGSDGSGSVDEGRGITIDGRGEIYVTGGFAGTATFGLGEPNEATLTAAGGARDLFIAKYGRDGELVWVTQAGDAESDDVGFGIAATLSGKSYVTGGHSGGPAAFLVAEYARDGELLWATEPGGTGLAIAANDRGESFVTGLGLLQPNQPDETVSRVLYGATQQSSC